MAQLSLFIKRGWPIQNVLLYVLCLISMSSSHVLKTDNVLIT